MINKIIYSLFFKNLIKLRVYFLELTSIALVLSLIDLLFIL